MEKPLLTALCVASLIGCAPPNAISDQSPPVTAQPSHTVAAKPGFRVVGNVFYFLNVPPEKVRRNDFKDQKAFDMHYSALLTALKKQKPIQDARYAFNNGARYFFTTNGTWPQQRQRGNPLQLGTPEMNRLCPNALSRLIWIEGYRLAFDSCTPDGSVCSNYGFASGDYGQSWNKEMSRLCLGGK